MSAPQTQPTFNHLGLFEGIGGFSLATRWAEWKTKAWCEIDPFCQKVLRKNFPTAHGFGDIKKLTYAAYKSFLRNRGDRDRRIDIITGGFPCQPYSTAGKRTGNDDDRALWPEMLRTIQEFKPRWVVGENVAGILSMDAGRVFDGIVTDLEDAGYSVETYIVPACGVGAPHKRDRVWIVAHATGSDDRRNAGTVSGTNGRQEWNDISKSCSAGNLHGPNTTNSEIDQCERFRNTRGWRNGFTDDNQPSPFAAGRRRFRRADIKRQGSPERGRVKHNNQRIDANANGARLEKLNAPEKPGFSGFGSGGNDAQWNEHWLSVATRICRVDDGISGGVDSAGGLQPGATTKSKAAGRGNRLKSLGNAIVPQVAFEIFKSINEFERSLFNQE